MISTEIASIFARARKAKGDAKNRRRITNILMLHNGYKMRGGGDEMFESEVQMLRAGSHSVEAIHVQLVQQPGNEVVGQLMNQRSSPIRVLIITRDFKLGSGVTKVVLDYIRHFPNEKIVVEHASFIPPESPYSQELVSRGIKASSLDERNVLNSFLTLHTLLRQRSFDLVVGTSWKPYVLAALARKGTSTKVAAWIHGIPLAVDGVFRKHLYRLLFLNRPIIFVSKAVQQAHSYNLHRGQQCIVYAGIPELPPLYPRTMRSTIGVPYEAFVVGYTAQFMEWKNHRVLLKVALALAETYPLLHLVLIGDGPLRERIARECVASRLDGRIHFLGNRADAKELLGTLDACIHPSDGEAFGLALAEAMLAGLPVLGSNTGAISEIIDDEISGFLVPPHDAPRICERLRQLIEDPVLRIQLGQGARQAIATRFTVGRFTTALTDAFENAAFR
jgi:glycosyltransferase involved in cell wall biosynthesis